MDRMSALDSGFLHIEDHHTSLHIGSVAIFEGPVPDQATIRAAILRKLPLVPRYRQRLITVPLGLARPVWADAPDFDIDDHLRRIAVRPPGTSTDLQDLVEALMSQRLDRRRPLWEDWVVEGLEDGRWALVTKVHHAIVDGIAGTDLLTTMLDHTADPVPAPVDPWAPTSEPGTGRLLVGAAREALTRSARAGGVLLGAGRHPREAASVAAVSARGVLGYARAALPVPRSSLRGPIGPLRRYRWAHVSIADVQAVRTGLGGTINDVVLAAISHGFRALLLSRGEQPGQHTVRTLVPVSVRRPDEHGHFDNRVSAIVAELPVEVSDTVAALAEVRARLLTLKSSHEAEAGELLTEIAEYVPPPLLAAALHVAFRVPQRLLTTVTTNVPGPRMTLYLAGRRMHATYPYVPIADRIRIGVALTSYDGQLFFGVTGDWETTPDIDVLMTGIHDGFSQLVSAAVQMSPAHGAEPT